MPTNLIGFTGKKQSGKNTAASFLEGFRQDSFAHDLKEILYSIQGIYIPFLDHFFTYQYVIDTIGIDRAKEEIPEVRHMMQSFGSEGVRRILGEDVWVDALFSRYTPGEKLAITDVRYANEAKAIHDRGGIVVRIVRPTAPEQSDTHSSENGLFPVDLTIVNDGDMLSLKEKVKDMLTLYRF
jgi:hypothetical protein